MAVTRIKAQDVIILSLTSILVFIGIYSMLAFWRSLGVVNCDIGQRQDKVYDGQEWYMPGGGWIIANIYTPDLSEHKLLLGPKQPRVFLLGGSSWYFSHEACEEVVQEQFKQNPLPAITIEELRKKGLVR